MFNAIAPVHLDVGRISDPAIIVADSDTLRGVVVIRGWEWKWGVCDGQQASQQPVSPDAIMVATVKEHATVIVGKVGGDCIEIMLDSGSSVSLVSRDLLSHIHGAIKI